MKNVFCSILLVMVSLFSVSASAVSFSDGGTALQGVLDQITIPSHSSSVDVNLDQISDVEDSYWSLTASGGSVSTMIIQLKGIDTVNNSVFGIYNGTQAVTLFNSNDAVGDSVMLQLRENGDGTFAVRVNGNDSGITFSTSSFGYFLDSNGSMFYSDTNLNSDGIDHMVAYQGEGDRVKLPGGVPKGTWTKDEYVLAWENAYGLSTLRAASASGDEDDDDGDGEDGGHGGSCSSGPRSFQSVGDAEYTDFVVMVESVNPTPVPEPASIALLGLGLIGFIVNKRSKKVC